WWIILRKRRPAAWNPAANPATTVRCAAPAASEEEIRGHLGSLLLCILLLLASAQLAEQSIFPSQQKANSRPEPPVTTRPQPESPLEITAKPRWFDEKIFEIYVVVKNIADKPVTAYATTSSNLSVPNSHKTCFIHSFPIPGKMLRRD